jgi:hypothetical protein
LDNTVPSAAKWGEPTAEEKEAALGYLPGSTAAAGLTQAQRCALLGESMDANTLQVLMAIGKAWSLRDMPASTDMALMAFSTQDGIGAGVAWQRGNCNPWWQSRCNID